MEVTGFPSGTVGFLLRFSILESGVTARLAWSPARHPNSAFRVMR